MNTNIEILAPAGSVETLQSAVYAGADAVYAGGEKFGARAYAKNFSKEELLSAIDFVHLHGRKLYLTVNTLIKEREMEELYSYLLPYYRQGVDAVIVQDLGALSFIKDEFPGLNIHASTQMTVTHILGAALLEQQKVERVVLSRELSLAEIRRIREQTNVEIECFVHGALCYCYSGQCLLSSMIGGRSGNRGQCAQPCRLPYMAGNSRKPQDFMSLKDLCTIDRIPELAEAGITSFKIEGRMKQPDYVETVVRMYRKYTDLYLDNPGKQYHVAGKDRRELEAAYQRRGYCGGYYGRQKGKEMLSLKRPDGECPQKGCLDIPKVQEAVVGHLRLQVAKPAALTLEYNGMQVEVNGDVVQAALKQPVSLERLEKQMKKTGNAPFCFEALTIEAGDHVFLPVQSMNSLRRLGMEQLALAVTAPFLRSLPKERKLHPKEMDCVVKDLKEPVFSALVERVEQLRAVLECPHVGRIYIEDTLLFEPSNQQMILEVAASAQREGRQVYFAMARIFRNAAKAWYELHIKELTARFDGALIRNMESLMYLKENGYKKGIAADANLYQWNRRAKHFFAAQGIQISASPLELNCHELMELGMEQMELSAYGYLPVMVTAGCIRENTDSCRKENGFCQLTDRSGRTFAVKQECRYCYNVMYNSTPVWLLDQKKEIDRLMTRTLRFSFSTEDSNTVREVLHRYTAVFVDGRSLDMPESEYTRGHFKRGVK